MASLLRSKPHAGVEMPASKADNILLRAEAAKAGEFHRRSTPDGRTAFQTLVISNRFLPTKMHSATGSHSSLEQ